MTPKPEENTAREDGSRWRRALEAYRTPNGLRSIGELAITATPFVLTWTAMYWSLSRGHFWLYVLLLLPAVGFLVRLFLIQHDCGHGAFFRSKAANDWAGRFISVLTLTPYDHWRRAHAIHHATSGNLTRRGVGDIDTLTVAEYQARSPLTRFRYRVYRNPLVMFGIGPLFVFALQNRLPAGFMRHGWRPWMSTMSTNVALLVVIGLLVSVIGVKWLVLVHLPIMALSATIGGWLFYVQHQFDRTYWAKAGSWNVHDAALYGSSHYDLPAVLKWFTANIGVHHVHHLSSKIPFYRLPLVLTDFPELRKVGRMTLLQSFATARLTLWDEDSLRLISFKQFRRRGDIAQTVGCT